MIFMIFNPLHDFRKSRFKLKINTAYVQRLCGYYVLILVDADGLVDFESPIWMADEQKNTFIKFLKRMFPDIEIVEGIKEKTKKPPRREGARRWTVEELHALLGPENNEELGRRLRRTSMSVLMERGQFIPTFTIWAKKKGYSFPPSVDKVWEFMVERGGRT